MAKKKKGERPEDTEESKATETERDDDDDSTEADEAEAEASSDDDVKAEADDSEASDDDSDDDADEDDASDDDESDEGDEPVASDDDADDSDDDDDAADDDAPDDDASDDDDSDDDDDEAAAKAKASSKKSDAKKSKKSDAKKSKKTDDAKKSTKKAAKKKKADSDDDDDDDDEKSKKKKAAAKKKKKSVGAPADPNAPISDNIRDLFGLDPNPAKDEREEEAEDYTPDGKTGASFGAVLGLLIAVAAIVGLVVGAVQVLKERQADIDAAAEKRKAEKDAAAVPEQRYGHIALLASEPPRALLLQDGKPIYVRTSDGRYTEMRVAPDTRITNIKIEEGGVVRYTIRANGYEDYQIELNEYSWTPIPGGTDWEKTYTKLRLDPLRDRFLDNCEEVAALGEPWLGACSVSVTDEIATRKDYERVYVDPETEVNVTLTGELTITSEPEGAKIWLNSRKLMKPDGTQATTPYTFTEYPGPAPKPAPPEPIEGEPDDGATPPTPPPTPAPAEGETVMNPISVTGSTSDGKLSVRLEKDGLDSYLTSVYPHFWTCTPQKDVEKIKTEVAPKLPKKSDETAPNMLHSLCTYTYTVNGKLFEPKPEPEEGEGEEGGEAPAE